MEVLFQDTNRLLSETQRHVQDLSSSYYNGNKDHLEAKVTDNANTIEQDLSRLRSLVNKQPPQHRQEAKSHFDQLSVDYNRLTITINSYYTRKHQLEEQVRQREELLSRRYTSNENANETAIPLEHAITHNNSLKNAHSAIDQMADIASGSLQGLRNQYGILQRASNTLHDVANTLGLSNTVMRLIARRTKQDRYIFWSGVAITILIVFLVLRYFL